MFTGIVTHVGAVASASEGEYLRVRVDCGGGPLPSSLGGSIACGGVCLTAVEIAPAENWFAADLSRETLDRTAPWTEGRRINLELPVRVGDELGGHIVTGHVDGAAELLSRSEEGNAARMRWRAPEDLAPLIAEKGSVAVDGVSLTVARVDGTEFEASVIPHTLEATTLGELALGDRSNLEVDILARYVARLKEAAHG